MDYKNVLKIVKLIKAEVKGLYITGSVKRKSPLINDIDFITTRNLSDVISDLGEIWPFFAILKDGKKHKSIFIESLDIQIDFWRALNKNELFYKRFLRDLPKGKAIYYKKLAKKQGLRLTDNGLYQNDQLLDITNRKDLLKIIM